MLIRNLKPLVIAISYAAAAIFYTKKRIKRAKLKSVHAKIGSSKFDN